MVGVILAGGRGIRFSGTGCCKPLLRINKKYLIEYSLENLRRLGVGEIIIVVGQYSGMIKKAVGSVYQGVPVRYVAQPEPVGLVNALYCAVGSCSGESAALQLSDEIFINAKYDELSKTDGADFICGYTVPENRRIICENYAIFCENGYITRTEEKPKRIVNEKKGTGFCVFNAACVDFLRQVYSEAFAAGDLCDFINLLVRNGKKGVAVHIAEEEININDPEMYNYAQKRMERAGHE